MNAPLRPDLIIRPEPCPQADLPLATPGVMRQVWESRYGPMLIEVKDGAVFVNGSRVVPASGTVPSGGGNAPA